MTKFGTLLPNGEVIEEREVDLNTVDSNDPLAFMFGFNQGERDAKYKQQDSTYKVNHTTPWRNLAKEYIRGYKYGFTGILVPKGTKILKGREQDMSLSHLNIAK